MKKRRYSIAQREQAEVLVRLTYADLVHLRNRLSEGAQRDEDRCVYLKLIAAEERLEAKYPITGG